MSGTTALRVQFPSGPITDADGNVTAVWRGYFQSLYVRTGSAPGASIPGIEASLAAETAARTSADAGLSNAITAERLARETGDLTEATARAAADATLLPKTGGTISGALNVAAGLTVTGSTRLNAVGVLGQVPVTTRPTITGSRGGNVALAGLLTALASFGLITDSTSP